MASVVASVQRVGAGLLGQHPAVTGQIGVQGGHHEGHDQGVQPERSSRLVM